MAKSRIIKHEESVAEPVKKQKIDNHDIRVHTSIDPQKSILPGPLVQLIFGYCDINRPHLNYKHSMFNTNEIYVELALPRLLSHVVRGKQEQAEVLIKNYPIILLKFGTAFDYSGRTLIDVTPLTAAYGADDDEMLAMMVKYLNKETKEIAFGHIKEKFADESEAKPYDFGPLIEAINTETNVEATLAIFRQHMKPGEVTKGKHFNIKVYLDAYQVYIDHWNPWRREQSTLFWTKVIGYLQRSLPACYAQAYCQGLAKVLRGSNPLNRDLKLSSGDHFYLKDANNALGLGFEFALFSYDNHPSIIATRDIAQSGLNALKKYVQKKQRLCESLCRIDQSVEPGLTVP